MLMELSKKCACYFATTILQEHIFIYKEHGLFCPLNYLLPKIFILNILYHVIIVIMIKGVPPLGKECAKKIAPTSIITAIYVTRHSLDQQKYAFLLLNYSPVIPTLAGMHISREVIIVQKCLLKYCINSGDMCVHTLTRTITSAFKTLKR